MCSSLLNAEIRTEVVEYKDGDVTLEGSVACDAAKETAVPGVLVVHQWTGLTDYEKGRCRQLAELGCVAFAESVEFSRINRDSAADLSLCLRERTVSCVARSDDPIRGDQRCHARRSLH